MSFEYLDALLRKFVDDGLPGCGCVVAKKEEILYEGYYGYADIEAKKPITPDSVFRQASLTKVAMYTTLMMLYEKGLFSMDEPLYSFFPEWRHSTKRVVRPDGSVDIVPVEHPITVKNIMNMTCGLPYRMLLGGVPGYFHPTSQDMAEAMRPLQEKGRYTLREEIAAISQVPLAFEPGTRWLYGFASELTAGLLEVLCGKPAELVIREQLFAPLGMDSSANFFLGDMKERLVRNYHLRPDKQLGEPDAIFIADSEQSGSDVGELGKVNGFARVMTTPRDYTKLFQMLANGGRYNGERFMGRKTIDLMRTNTITDTMIREDYSNSYLAGYGYGYGVRTMNDPYGGQHNGSLGNFGWTGGSGTWGEADPSEGVSIVYMHNLQPNLEEYHHLRMRAAAYAGLE